MSTLQGAPDDTPDIHDILLQQHQQCRFDIRNYDTTIWQTIAVAYLLNGVLIGNILGNRFKGPGAIVSSVALLVLTVPLTVGLIKQRFFQESRVDFSRRFSRQLGMDEIPFTTMDVMASRKGTVPQGLWGQTKAKLERLPAFRVVLATLILSHSGQIVMLLVSICRTVN